MLHEFFRMCFKIYLFLFHRLEKLSKSTHPLSHFDYTSRKIKLETSLTYLFENFGRTWEKHRPMAETEPETHRSMTRRTKITQRNIPASANVVVREKGPAKLTRRYFKIIILPASPSCYQIHRKNLKSWKQLRCQCAAEMFAFSPIVPANRRFPSYRNLCPPALLSPTTPFSNITRHFNSAAEFTSSL